MATRKTINVKLAAIDKLATKPLELPKATSKSAFVKGHAPASMFPAAPKISGKPGSKTNPIIATFDGKRPVKAVKKVNTLERMVGAAQKAAKPQPVAKKAPPAKKVKTVVIPRYVAPSMLSLRAVLAAHFPNNAKWYPDTYGNIVVTNRIGRKLGTICAEE